MLHVAPIKDVSVNKSMTFSPLFFARDRISKLPFYVAIVLQITLLASIHTRGKLRNAEAHIIFLDLSFNFQKNPSTLLRKGVDTRFVEIFHVLAWCSRGARSIFSKRTRKRGVRRSEKDRESPRRRALCQPQLFRMYKPNTTAVVA